MAQIPTWQPSITKQAGSMQPVTAPMSDMGAPVFAGIKENIQALKNYQDQQDKYAASTAYDNAQQQLQSAFYGEDGVFTRKGANALGAKETDTTPEVPDVTKQSSNLLTKIGNDAMKNLSTRQQQIFSAAWREPTNTYTNLAAKYQNQQQGVAYKESYDSANTTLTNGFSTNMMMVSQQQNVDLKNQFQQAANQNIRDMVSNEIMYGKRIGLTDAEINTNVQKRINGSLKDTALNLLTDGNVGAAKDLVTYYGDKLDANTYSDIEAKLRPALIKQDAVNTTQALFNKYGIDNEKGAYDEITKLKGDSPDLPIYLNNLKQFYGDQQKFQKQASDKYYETTFGQVLNAGSATNMQSILDNATNLLPSQRITIQNHIDKIAGRDRRIAKGTSSKDDKWRSDYESSGGLDRDIETMKAYYRIVSGLEKGDVDAKEITPQGQIKYNLASIRLKKYGFGGAVPEQPQEQQQTPNPQAGEYDRLFRAIKAKYPNASDDEVYAYMTHKFGGQ